MRKMVFAAMFCAFAVLQPAHVEAQPSHIEQIRERLQNANLWRDHVMVVAHRGGGMDARKSKHPENSISAVLDSIRLGVEMVELDIQKSSDGEFVVFHDSWLDRSSDCKGVLAERTLAELKKCRLVIEGTGAVTDERIPTLREMLAATRDRIFVNVDNKLDLDALPEIVAVARRMGMADQLVIKSNLWNDDRIARMAEILEQTGEGPVFMPIVADDAVRDSGFLETVTSTFKASAVELIAWHRPGEGITSNGGPLFTTLARAVAARGNWHLWVNTYTIVNKPAGMLSGGRGDELAVLADLPGEAFGFWIDRGVTIIQTDEPTAAIKWLSENGYRKPYGGDADPGAHQAALADEIPPGQ